MRDPNIVKFSHSKLVYVESIKTISLHVVNGISVWIKTVQERGKNASYESSKVSRVVQNIGSWKIVLWCQLSSSQVERSTIL